LEQTLTVPFLIQSLSTFILSYLGRHWSVCSLRDFPTKLASSQPPSRPLLLLLSRDSVVGIATGYGLDDRGVGVRVSVKTFLHVVQTGSRVHPTYLIGTEGSFPGCKAAGEWSWQLTTS
jgi:hypothetical protein